MTLRALLAAACIAALLLAGCTSEPADTDGDGLTDEREAQLGSDPTLADSDSDGLGDAREAELGTSLVLADTDGDGVLDLAEIEAGTDPLVAPFARFLLSVVGQPGAEPSIGVTSSGCAFFTAFEKVMRSCDAGKSWENVTDPVACQNDTSDPYLWVDPVTDRVFDIQMVDLVTTWICWSDDDGETWLGNPADNGPLPVNDHIKLATGPWTSAGYGLVGQGSQNAYAQATYFCYNKLVGIHCYTSFDGGASFPVGATVVGNTQADGGLHGAISTAPDGTVYVPPRLATPTLAYSKDNGLTWASVEMGRDAGTPNPRKNSEVAADTASNAYHTWVGKDLGVYLARSTDSGVTWDKTSLRVSPPELVSATFPHIQAGDPGRIAIAYLASDDAEALGTDDIDGDKWDGNPHTAPDAVHYDLYVTFSLNALDAAPTWQTIKVTTDPVQVGSICISSGDCRSEGGKSNRNLLDFNDLSLDRDGRVYVAYADGCVDKCAEDPAKAKPSDSRARESMVAILETGPSLYAAKGTLSAPAPQ